MGLGIGVVEAFGDNVRDLGLEMEDLDDILNALERSDEVRFRFDKGDVEAATGANARGGAPNGRSRRRLVVQLLQRQFYLYR